MFLLDARTNDGVLRTSVFATNTLDCYDAVVEWATSNNIDAAHLAYADVFNLDTLERVCYFKHNSEGVLELITAPTNDDTMIFKK